MKYFSLALLLTILYSCTTKKETSIKPNLVFYISDDLSASDITLYNNKGIEVPNITKLASEGITFNNAFIASPSCAPSRGALLTGLYPARNGAQANHTYSRPSILKLPKVLQKMGYEVVVFGKIAHGFGKETYTDYGFDYFTDRKGFDEKTRLNFPELVRSFFKDRENKKPICLLVGDKRPHVPWLQESNYPDENIKLPSTFIDTKETREHWARYATDIQGMDKDLGEILSISKKMFGDNYVFLFSADHGSQWPFGKWNLYDYGINVPLVISSPSLTKKGSRTDAMVSWVDVFPTLIDIAGGVIPEGIDGKSFASVLTNPDQSHRDFIYTTHSGDGDFNVYPIRSIRTERFKYIHNLFPENLHTNHSDILRKDGAGAYWDSWDEMAEKDEASKAIIDKYFLRPEFEFFDLKNDPKEQNNLADSPEFRENQEVLKKLLKTMNLQQKDSLQIIGVPHPISKGRPNKQTIEGRRKG